MPSDQRVLFSLVVAAMLVAPLMAYGQTATPQIRPGDYLRVTTVASRVEGKVVARSGDTLSIRMSGDLPFGPVRPVSLRDATMVEVGERDHVLGFAIGTAIGAVSGLATYNMGPAYARSQTFAVEVISGALIGAVWAPWRSWHAIELNTP